MPLRIFIDRIFCLGVLQHTPNFENSVKSLISKLKLMQK